MKMINDDITDIEVGEDEASRELFEHVKLVVDKGQSMIRIDKFLSGHLENTSRARIQSAADADYILVNGKPVKSSYKVKPLDVVQIMMPYERQQIDVTPQNIPLDIVYEDDELIVINKNAGMVVHPGHGNWDKTLVNALAFHLQDSPMFNDRTDIRAGLVHRIDKNTSGLLVVAKTLVAHAHLSKQFFNHTIERTYHAITWGVPTPAEGTIEGNIGRSVRDRLQMTVLKDDDPTGKTAITHYKVLEPLGYVALVQCNLETGRTHQIRVHMRHLGHPLFNDERYGGDTILRGTTFTKYKQFVQNCFDIMPRHGLHAISLGFQHPTTGQWMQFSSSYPTDFADCLEKWRLYGKSKQYEEN